MRKNLLWIVGICVFFIQYFGGVALAYDVSGTIQNNTGNSSSRVYVVLKNPGASYFTSFGTSIASIPNGTSGNFTIHGVPPGSYEAYAFMDIDSTGSLHINNPANSSAGFTIGGSNLNIGTISLSPPGTTQPTAVGKLNVVTTSNGALMAWNGPKSPYGGSGPNAELADSYVIYWGSNPNPGNGSAALGNKTITANGGSYHVFINNLSPGASLYFAVKAVNNNGGSAYTATSTPHTIAAQTGNASVSGRVYSAGITKTASTPLYIALQSSNGFYIADIPSPADAQLWTITGVAAGTYNIYVILDLNNDGFATDVGKAVSRGMQGGGSPITVTVPSGATSATAPDVTLYAPNSHTVVTTQNQGNSWYQLQFRVNSGLKRPVSATINSGPNISGPIDLGLALDSGSGARFGSNGPVAGFSTRPAIGDSYSVTVGYSDSSTETLNPSVTGVVSSFPTPVFPQGNTSPINTNSTLFAWTSPSFLPAGYYDYTLWMNTTTSSNFWSPQDNSNSNMPATQLSIPFNVDGSAPLSSLTSGNYNWIIAVNDGNNNQGWAGLFTDLSPQSSGPSISSFTPATGSTGTTVTINGSGFTGATNVGFGGVSATTYTIVSDTQITAAVPAGAPVGLITVTSNGVTGGSSTTFATTVTFSNSVKYSSTAVAGATVTVENSNPVISTTTDASGNYNIPVPSGVPFALRISKSPYRDTLTALFLFTANSTGASSHKLYMDSDLAALGLSVANKGLIAASVKDWDLNSNLSGATLTATSFLHPEVPYTVTYSNNGTATGSDGVFYVANVDEGDTVAVKATLNGYKTQPRTFLTHTGVISQTRVDATPLPSATASPSGGSISFDQTITLSVSSPIGGDTYAIFYTTDGSDPTNSGSVQQYNGPFTLNPGTVTLKFYAINTTHNAIGAVSTATYTVTAPTYSLTVTINGTGSGSVLINPPGTQMNSGIQSIPYTPGTGVALTATPDVNSLVNWAGCDSLFGYTCNVTLNSNRSVTTTFTSVAPLRLNGTDQQNIQTCFNLASNGSQIQARSYSFTENPILNIGSNNAITFKGGFDLQYSSNSGNYSTLHGFLTITTGDMTVENLIIAP